MLELLLDEAVMLKASDLHCTSGMKPMVRIGGKLKALEGAILHEQDINLLLVNLLDDKKIKAYEENRQIDFAYDYGRIRLRVHIYKQMDNDAIAIRLLEKTIPNMKDLGLPKSVEKLTEYRDGLVLITGKTGSGKSTTLASMIDLINKRDNKHIVTIEDPIEYIHKSDRCLIHQREVGRDVHSFSDGVRASLREDPDIVVIGELRDLDTIKTCITVAETGHLVFATIHTKSVSETINRMVDVFPVDQQNQVRIQLSESLRGIISQDLLERDNSDRVPVCELMFMNTAIKNLIRENGNVSSLVDQISMGNCDQGSQSKIQGIIYLLSNSIISMDQAKCILDENEVKSLSKMLKYKE